MVPAEMVFLVPFLEAPESFPSAIQIVAQNGSSKSPLLGAHVLSLLQPRGPTLSLQCALTFLLQGLSTPCSTNPFLYQLSGDPEAAEGLLKCRRPQQGLEHGAGVGG